MQNRTPLFARALLILLAALLSACQAISAPVSASGAAAWSPTPLVDPSYSSTPTAAQPSLAPTFAAPSTATTTPIPTLPASPTPAASVITSTGRLEVPILMYHRIRDDGVTRYITTTSAFRDQMQALKDMGYHTITIEQMAQALSRGAALPEHPIVLTFDDGYLDVYENALPVMKEMGFIGVAYIITITQEKEKAYGYMQAPELKALVESGWEIGSHSITHSDLMKSKVGMGNEIQKSRDILEQELGIKIHSFSYPYGTSNPSIEEFVEKSGYDAAVGIGTTITHTPKRLYYLSRREVYRGLTLDQFRALLQPGEADQYVGTPAVTPTP